MKRSNLKAVWMPVMVGILFLLCLSCAQNAEENGEGGTNNVDEYQFQNTGTPIGWKCFNADTDEVCVPNEWEKVGNQKFHFFSYLSNEVNPNRFFVVVKQ